MESASTEVCTKSQGEFTGRLVTYATRDLHAHPSYARLGLTTPTDKLSALRQRGELAFAEPLTITRDRTIIDGYARWDLAKEEKRPVLHCIEYQISEAAALQRLLQTHSRSNGLNAFNRIRLALELEPWFKEKARSNQQAGGQQKGWSKLTEAEKVHVRSEIARAAAVSVGNVSKVKQLLDDVIPQFIEALHAHEISIHWAWKLRKADIEDQLDALGRLRFEKGIIREVRQRAFRHRGDSVPIPPTANEIATRLSGLSNKDLESVGVTVLKSPGV